MKHFILFISTLLLTFGVQGQDFDPQKNNYLLLTKNIKQLSPVLLTAEELAKEDGNSYGEFYVVICGKTVKDIPNNNNFKKLLDKANDQHVKVFVCGISLDKFNINPTSLPEQLIRTENGILFGFQYTKKGFISLTI